jgi:hypothetical protein
MFFGNRTDGAFDSTGIVDSMVILDKGTYKMWHLGYGGSKYLIGYADHATPATSDVDFNGDGRATW